MNYDNDAVRVRLNDLIRCAASVLWQDLSLEPTLLHSRWHAYRFTNPLSLTHHFANEYRKAFQSAFSREIDRERAKIVRGLDLHRSRHDLQERTQLWRARQRADATGMPYGPYLEFCFSFHTRYNRTRFPRPSQLHGTGKAADLWERMRRDFWDERLREGLYEITELPQFRIEHYRGLSVQDSYRSFVLDRAREASQPTRVMRRYSVDLRQVPIAAFKRGTERSTFNYQLRQLRADMQSFPAEASSAQPVSSDMFWISCFGLPRACRPDSQPCTNCSSLASCQMVSEMVEAKVAASSGSADPVARRKTELAAERKRKQRSRQRAAARHREETLGGSR